MTDLINSAVCPLLATADNQRVVQRGVVPGNLAYKQHTVGVSCNKADRLWSHFITILDSLSLAVALCSRIVGMARIKCQMLESPQCNSRMFNVHEHDWPNCHLMFATKHQTSGLQRRDHISRIVSQQQPASQNFEKFHNLKSGLIAVSQTEMWQMQC